MKKLNSYYLSTFIIIIVIIGIMFLGEINGIFLSPKEQTEEQTEDSNMIVVGVSQLGYESVWRLANTKSVEEALTKENNFFPIINNARQNQENQIKAIRDFISQDVDYIVLAPVTETGWDSVLKEAKDAGIPVILMDREVDVQDTSLFATHIGSDMELEGVRAGNWLEGELERREIGPDEKVNIVILQGTPGSSSQIGRETGFYNVASKNPNWTILEKANADFTTAKGKQEMARLLKRYDKIDVVFSENDDMTFGAIEAINEAGKTVGVNGDIIMISFDAGHDALVEVYNGHINVDIECNPLLGNLVAEVIKKMDAGQPVGKKYIIDEKVFTKENVETYLGNRKY